MRATDAYLWVRDLLRQSGVEDAGFDARQLLGHVSGLSRFSEQALSPEEWRRLQQLAHRRAGREPLQYLLGRWPFLDLELAVGPGVLIPRPETEELCLAALDCAQGRSGLRVLDLCSGTGALALGLQSRLPDAHVTALELSEEAFAYLGRNIREYARLHARVPYAVQGDALAYHRQLATGCLDLLVSNPPYVTQEEYEGLEPELYHEPAMALVAGEDGLLFYRRIAADYFRCLAPGGALLFEVGETQGPAVAALLAEAGYGDIRLQKDLAGRERIAVAHKVNSGA